MDPRELEVLAKRLGENANDTEALNAAYAHGQTDPRGYAVFLEKAGTYSADPTMGAHWFCEAANVWTASMSDAHRAERALVRAVDTDPLNQTATERLVALHREKANTKGIAALHQRRAKNVEKLLPERPDLAVQAAAIYAELARVFSEELNLPDKAIEAFRKAAEYNPADAYSIYQAREMLKSTGRLKEALPLYAAEQALIQDDPARRAALYADEIDVCRQAGDTEALLAALRGARSVDTEDPALKQQLASTILELSQAGKRRSQTEIDEAVALFVELAETYDGEHGHSYSLCALSLEPGQDRAAQLAMFYGDQIGKSAETAHAAAAYLRANPHGAVAGDARTLVASALSAGGDDALIAALTPPKDASEEVKASSFSVIARAMASQGRDAEAAKYYRLVLESSPADEDAVACLAKTLRGKKDRELRDLLLAAARVPNAPLTQRAAWLGEVAELCEGPLRDIAGAIEARRQLVLLDPSDESAADQLEAILETAKRWDDLAELITRRAQTDPDAASQLERELRVAAIHRDKRGDNRAAAEALSRAAYLEPEDLERVFSAVDLFVSADAGLSAIGLLQELLRRGVSSDARAQYSLRMAELLESSGALVEAGGAYAEAGSGLSDPELWGKAQHCFEQGQAWEQAARATAERRALVDSPDDKAELCAQEAEYLFKLGDGEGGLVCLKDALDFNPRHDAVAAKLEHAFVEQERHSELVSLLLTRARVMEDPAVRVSYRKRAAFTQRDQLSDEEGMRQALVEVLEDGEDAEALRVLADDAEAQGQQTLTVDYLERLSAVLDDDGKAEVALRLAKLLEGEGDEEGALEHYQIALGVDPNNVDILSAVAHLQRSTGDAESSAQSYKRLLDVTEGDQKLATARTLGGLLAELDRIEEAISAYKIVLELDPEDLETVENLRDLAESAEKWQDFAKYQAQLVDVEGDEDEASKMALRLSEVLLTKLDNADAALNALIPFARAGDDACREEYERLGDSLGRQEEVAESLVEWCQEAPAGPQRNRILRTAYDRFIQVQNRKRAIDVGLELVRMKGASEELAKSVEETALPLKHIEALQAAFVVLGQDLSGPSRSEELVRQAEVLAAAGLDPFEAVQHGEQALTSTDPADVEPLLTRLAEVAHDPEGIIGVYQRQVTRCKSPDDKISALCRAAQVAAEQDDLDRVKKFYEIALQSAGQEDGIDRLRQRVKADDEDDETTVLRESLAVVLSSAGRNARDGGRSHALYLAHAARVAYEDLGNLEGAFGFYHQALVAHTDEELLEQLVEMGEQEDALARVAEVIGETLESVHDGPLVRMLLRFRLELRANKLDDDEGAGEDLKRLYELSPSDGDIATQLEERYKSTGDDRGLVSLYEDQILRGRDQAIRADLARKVALIWQDVLQEPREAADAWRRVLRMNAGDEEAKEGLNRAKQGMRKVSAKEVAEAEQKTRKEVEARLAQEEAEAKRREAELEAKAIELKARHSAPPPPLPDDISAPKVQEAQDAPPPPGAGQEEPVASTESDESATSSEASSPELDEQTTERAKGLSSLEPEPSESSMDTSSDQEEAHGEDEGAASERTDEEVRASHTQLKQSESPDDDDDQERFERETSPPSHDLGSGESEEGAAQAEPSALGDAFAQEEDEGSEERKSGETSRSGRQGDIEEPAVPNEAPVDEEPETAEEQDETPDEEQDEILDEEQSEDADDEGSAETELSDLADADELEVVDEEELFDEIQPKAPPPAPVRSAAPPPPSSGATSRPPPPLPPGVGTGGSLRSPLVAGSSALPGKPSAPPPPPVRTSAAPPGRLPPPPPPPPPARSAPSGEGGSPAGGPPSRRPPPPPTRK